MAIPSAPVDDASGGVPIAEASGRLGVPMPTLRSWELRYNMPPVARVAGRHRRYASAELHALRLMRDEIARGTRASLAAQRVRDLLGLVGAPVDYIEGILAASERLDPAAVRAELAAAHASLGLAACLDDVLMPAMQQIGLWWQSGRCDVGQEHLTTEAARAWLESLVPYAPAPASSVPVVLACGPTDLHTIGLEALGLLLRYRGQPCRLLGARTSVTALVTAIQVSQARAAVLVSHLNSGRQRAIQALRAVDDLGVAVYYAGNAFGSPRSRRGLPGTYLGDRLDDACSLVLAATA
ncbi:B12-binding domain-containing protein [Jatrophihabitans sp.]|uniref:MerR family transcriptional regulator n=1 Tax=Jatrophihabitans sp. TaxID=1932789 RepID=UPI0030C7193A|nr:MerR family DNA-binding transcriptional regulator [Jatrophihabitans sp.]